jgi:hypothetical protein
VSERDFELMLANFPRSLTAIATAVAEGADLNDEATPVDRAGRITRGLVERYMIIDRVVVTYLVMALTGYLAEVSKRSPRQIHEELFREAPSDAWWENHLAGRDRREETE